MHKVLHKNVHKEEDIQESNNYFNTEIEHVTSLKQNVHE